MRIMQMMTQKIHVNCDLRHFLISGKIGKKKKGNIKQFVKKAGISAAVVQKFRLFSDFTEHRGPGPLKRTVLRSLASITLRLSSG